MNDVGSEPGVRFSLRQVAGFIVLLSMVSALAYYLIRARQRFFREETTYKFQMVVLGLHNYHETYGYFPKAVEVGSHGKDSRSWRWVITPYLERSGEYSKRRPDEPWDSPANRSDWIDKGWQYCYPGNGDESCILAVTGRGTAFGDRDDPACRIDDIDIDTILLVESRDSGFAWPQPGDTDVSALATHRANGSPKGLSSIHAGGFHVAFADGTVWFIRKDIPFDRLRRFFTIEGARTADRDQILAPFRIR